MFHFTCLVDTSGKVMKSIFESKIIWLGLATLLLSILTFFQGEQWIQEYPKVVAGIGSAIGVLTIVLRFLLVNQWL